MKFFINKGMFSDREFTVLENELFSVAAFKYSTGVHALKVCNNRGYFIILPFQGQQIWRAVFDGKELYMKTKFSEPNPGVDYLETYGGFLLHCGINSMGIPDGTHPQHGELPNADYNSAYIDVTEDYVAVGGLINYDKSFVKNYTFSPECRLYNNETLLKVHVCIENRRHYPMEYMYLCHMNFRPIDGGTLHYTADYDKVTPYDVTDPADMSDGAVKLRSYIKKLEENPQIHHTLDRTNQVYDPEICFKVDLKGDKDGRAHTLFDFGDGAWYVNSPVDVLPVGIRWISRTLDEDSLGMVLPATGEHLGYTYAKEHNQIKFLPPLGKLEFDIIVGLADKNQAGDIKKIIDNVRNNH